MCNKNCIFIASLLWHVSFPKVLTKHKITCYITLAYVSVCMESSGKTFNRVAILFFKSLTVILFSNRRPFPKSSIGIHP